MSSASAASFQHASHTHPEYEPHRLIPHLLHRSAAPLQMRNRPIPDPPSTSQRYIAGLRPAAMSPNPNLYPRSCDKMSPAEQSGNFSSRNAISHIPGSYTASSKYRQGHHAISHSEHRYCLPPCLIHHLSRSLQSAFSQ